MAHRVAWTTNGQGWWVTTTHGVFIALMRPPEDDARRWQWVGFANGHPLGRFDGLALAKKEAPRRARGLLKGT